MATMKFSLPDDLLAAFNKAFAGTDKSALLKERAVLSPRGRSGSGNLAQGLSLAREWRMPHRGKEGPVAREADRSR
jgi:hypothetical protein